MIVAVAIPAVIAAARVVDVPAAQKTAITVHVLAARIESTKLQDKNEEINKFLLFL